MEFPSIVPRPPSASCIFLFRPLSLCPVQAITSPVIYLSDFKPYLRTMGPFQFRLGATDNANPGGEKIKPILFLHLSGTAGEGRRKKKPAEAEGETAEANFLRNNSPKGSKGPARRPLYQFPPLPPGGISLACSKEAAGDDCPEEKFWNGKPLAQEIRRTSKFRPSTRLELDH